MADKLSGGTTIAGNVVYHAGNLNGGSDLTLRNLTTNSILSQGNITAYSDLRVKKDIRVIPDSLAKVCMLNGYTFERSDIATNRQTGVIAQEVQKVLPEAVTEAEDGKLSVAYGNMVGLLIEGIKELREQNEVLANRIMVLESG